MVFVTYLLPSLTCVQSRVGGASVCAHTECKLVPTSHCPTGGLRELWEPKAAARGREYCRWDCLVSPGAVYTVCTQP